MLISKKTFLIAFIVFVLVLTSIVGSGKVFAQNMSVAVLQQQINDLLRQISELQAKLILINRDNKTVGVEEVLPNEIIKELKQGDENTEVKLLQTILNKDKDTAIKGSSLGSVGKETSYFGNLTLDALNRFQEKYFDEVLLPQNKATPTGVVDFYTRIKLNDVLNGKKQEISTSQAPNIISLSPESGPNGTVIKIKATGLAPTNTVFTSLKTYNNLVSEDGSTLSILLDEEVLATNDLSEFGGSSTTLKGELDPPADMVISSFPINLQIKNANGESNVATFNVTF